MEPERPIEEALRACAKKRRDQAGAPFTLHGATRRLLQGEVARQYPAAQPAGAERVRRPLWPTLAWSFGVLAVLAVAGLLWFSRLGPEPAFLAENSAVRQAAPEVPAPSPAPPPVSTPAPLPEPAAARSVAQYQTAVDEMKAAPRPTGQLADKDLSSAVGGAAPALAPPAASAGVVLKEKTAPPNEERDRPTVAAATPPAPTAGGELGMVTTRRLADSAVKSESLNQPKALPAAPLPTAGSQTDVALNAPTVRPSPDDGITLAKKVPLASDVYVTQPGAPVAQASPAADTAMARGVAAQQSGVPTATNAVGPFLDGVQRGLASQQFVRVGAEGAAPARRSSQSEPASPVLISFQAEQSGQQLRVVDSDGSVYTGSLELVGSFPPATDREESRAHGNRQEPAARVRSLSGALPAGGPPAPDRVLPPVSGYFFRVTGTNRTLNAKVVFVGNLSPGTNVMLQGFGGGGAVPPPALATARITGKVRVGDQPELEVNAVPAASQER